MKAKLQTLHKAAQAIRKLFPALATASLQS